MWPILLGDRLPTIHVPLLGRGEQVPLDVQLAFSNVYDQCGLELAVDYSKPREVGLDPEQAVWAQRVLSSARARDAERR